MAHPAKTQFPDYQNEIGRSIALSPLSQNEYVLAGVPDSHLEVLSQAHRSGEVFTAGYASHFLTITAMEINWPPSRPNMVKLRVLGVARPSEKVQPGEFQLTYDFFDIVIKKANVGERTIILATSTDEDEAIELMQFLAQAREEEAPGCQGLHIQERKVTVVTDNALFKKKYHDSRVEKALGKLTAFEKKLLKVVDLSGPTD